MNALRIRACVAACAVAAVLAGPPAALAATCSCAAVPLLGSMDTGAPAGGSWLVTGGYEFHEIGDLYSGSDEVPDETGRERSSRALVLQASRGFGERLSVTALLSAVEHERRVGGQTTTGRGLGDGLVMLKYSPKRIGPFERNGLTLGVGTAIPLGEDDARDFVTLAEDMQPSTGAWAPIAWVHGERAWSQAANTRSFASLSYRWNGENDRSYRFGDAWTAALGTTHRTGRWGLGFELRYRDAGRDERAAAQIPNTGGRWLDGVPAVQFQFTDRLAGKVSARVPVWRDVNDALQFTTSYAVSVSLSWVAGGP